MLIESVEYLRKKVNKYLCVSRPRRLGKSTDAEMLVAYYSKGCHSKNIFDQLKISSTENYLDCLNKSNVIYIDMQDFLSKTHDIHKMKTLLADLILRELKKVYSDIDYYNPKDLVQIFDDIYGETGEEFVFIVDEWDCVFREYQNDTLSQKIYLDFLRNLWKGKRYVSLVYMTGILPIKKYGTHSTLNMFKEISMLNPTPLEQFMGFTQDEVCHLCKKYNMDYEKMKDWYDGYQMTSDLSIYNHRSVVYAIMDRKYENYWSNTETYEALKTYIDLNFDDLKTILFK